MSINSPTISASNQVTNYMTKLKTIFKHPPRATSNIIWQTISNSILVYPTKRKIYFKSVPFGERKFHIVENLQQNQNVYPENFQSKVDYDDFPFKTQPVT